MQQEPKELMEQPITKQDKINLIAILLITIAMLIIDSL
jgi:hypothetical protein